MSYTVKNLYYYFLDKNWVLIKTQFNDKEFSLSFYNKVDDEMKAPSFTLMNGEWS